MSLYIVTIGLVFAILVGSILVERTYRTFARRNPQLGPFRKEGKQDCCSCTGGSGCNADSCHS